MACLWIVALFASSLGAVGVFNEFPRFGWIATTSIGVLTIVSVRHVGPLVLILLFNLLFYVYAFPHIWLDLDLVSASSDEVAGYLVQALWIVSLFVISIVFWIWSGSPHFISSTTISAMVRRLDLPKADWLFYTVFLISTALVLWGIRGRVVFGEGGYDAYIENLQVTSGLPEYMLVLLLFAALLIRKRIHFLLWLLLLSVFVLKLAVLGFRVVALMGMVMGLLFSRVDLTAGRILAIFVGGFCIGSVLGLLKNGLSAEQILSSLLFEVQDGGVVSHHTNVLWASTVVLQLIDGGMLDFSRRALLGIHWALNAVLPSRFLHSVLGERYLAAWLQEMGYTAGGGHAAVFAYVAGGPLGVVLLGSLIGVVARISYSHCHGTFPGFVRCWLLMVYVTFPRWISYDVGNFLLRLPAYVGGLYLLLEGIRRVKHSRRLDDGKV